jgi:bacillithiol biosynthesis cysteine-adding enzyme BshC
VASSPSAPSSDSALRLAVDVRRFPWMRRLAIDYSFDYAQVADFFSGDPTQSSAWAGAIRVARAHSRPRAQIAAVIAAQQDERGAPEQACAAGRSLADPRTVAIVTGQQAGLFGGPLYTLLKAITAIRLAARIGREHNVPVVPVFWIDSEDHDWEEIATLSVVDADGTLRPVRVNAPEGAGDRPIAWLQYTDDVTRAIDDLSAALPQTEFTAGLVEALRADYVPGRRVSEAFGRWLDRTLGPHGLVVYDAADRAAKPFAAPLFRAELENPGRTSRLAAEAGAQLTARGYHSQVVPADASVALFWLDGGRRAIRTSGDGFVIGDEKVTRESLVERATVHPESFSPNVLLRPLVQDAIFPTICYVAGPNELAYLGQLKGVYASVQLPMPLIQPRATATILDSAGVRFLTRYKVPLEELEARDEHALNDLLRTQLPPSVERAVQDADAEIAARMDAVIRAVPAIDPTLEGAARSTLGKIEHDMRNLRAKIVQAAKRRDDTLKRQFMHVRAQAFPGGTPQERTVGYLAFLNKFGPALVERLAAELPIDGGTHWIITV